MNKIVISSITLSLVLHVALLTVLNCLTHTWHERPISINNVMRIEIIMNSIKKEKKAALSQNEMISGKKQLPSNLKNNTKSDNYLNLIRSRINKVKYMNPLAERLKIQGEVDIEFKLKPNSKVISEMSIIKSSGNSLLDQSAIETIERFKKEELPLIPKVPSQENNLSVRLKIIYN